MRLSPWHCELAKRVAEGKKYPEISQEIKISQSRLSVLKANPLFMQQVRKYREIKDDVYKSALTEMEKGAVDVAKEVVSLATSKMVPAQVRLNAARELLDRVGSSSKVATPLGGENEVSFEQILRITKRGTKSTDFEQDGEEVDTQSAHLELMKDFEDTTKYTETIPNEAA